MHWQWGSRTCSREQRSHNSETAHSPDICFPCFYCRHCPWNQHKLQICPYENVWIMKALDRYLTSLLHLCVLVIIATVSWNYYLWGYQGPWWIRITWEVWLACWKLDNLWVARPWYLFGWICYFMELCFTVIETKGIKFSELSRSL